MAAVPVTSVGVIDDNTAKQMSLVDNERYGEDDAVELQRLIESIQAEIDYSLADIAPYDEEMTERWRVSQCRSRRVEYAGRGRRPCRRAGCSREERASRC
jgi:hypothetical protein